MTTDELRALYDRSQEVWNEYQAAKDSERSSAVYIARYVSDELGLGPVDAMPMTRTLLDAVHEFNQASEEVRRRRLEFFAAAEAHHQAHSELARQAADRS